MNQRFKLTNNCYYRTRNSLQVQEFVFNYYYPFCDLKNKGIEVYTNWCPYFERNMRITERDENIFTCQL